MGIFDFGGVETNPRNTLKTPAESGGFFDWMGVSDFGAFAGVTDPGVLDDVAEKAKEKATGLAASAGRVWVNGSLTRLFEGSDFLGFDLVEVGKEKASGWLPDLNLTPAGRKMALIAGAAAVLFFLTRGR